MCVYIYIYTRICGRASRALDSPGHPDFQLCFVVVVTTPPEFVVVVVGQSLDMHPRYDWEAT